MSSTCASSSTYTTKKKTKNDSKKISFAGDEPNYEDFSLVWLSEKRNQIEVPGQLRSIINYLKLYHNVEQCVKYVLSIQSEKIFLIIPDTLSNAVIPRVHDHCHLEHIYIYCPWRVSNDLCVEKYPKVSGIFTDNVLMMKKLKTDYQSSSHNLCSTSMLISEKKTTNTDLNNTAINWFPFLIETVIYTPQSDLMKKYLLNKCELDYIDNELEQKSIEDFRQHYKAADVFSWYKRDCFIYRLLNKALRSESIATLFKFRFFLTDLHCQLEKLHLSFIEQAPVSQNQWTFYRGQGMNNEEFNKIKVTVGQLISINTFFLTTTNFETAMECASNAERNSSVQSIVFEIVVNRSVAKLAKPFGVITQDEDANEILFSPGTVFHTESIEQHDSVWYIKLKLVNEKQTREMNEFKELSKREYDRASPLTLVGYFFWKIGKYDKAELIFSLVFEELRSFNNDQISAIYNDIGLLYSDRGYYNKALDYYEKSLKNAKKNRLPNIAHIATILNNIGLLFANKKQHQVALKYYKQALQMRVDMDDPKSIDLTDMASIYANIGCIYADAHLFSQALINLEKALDIRQKELPAHHPHIGQSYNYIGYVYFLQCHFKKALKIYQTALDINLAASTVNHHELLKIYKNIAAAHFGEQKYSLAIEYYEKAIDVGIKSLPNDHHTMVQLFQSIACCYKAIKEHHMVLKYFRKALDIEKNRSKLNNALLFEIYTHVGAGYEAVGKNSMALNTYKTGLKHGFKMKNQNFSRMSTVQGAIQRCINRENQATTKNTTKEG
ncbi:unnamed protein product [Rotaria socialis]|uniref:NAD(P)(+)--arginine ADP-ribosyltransferase n=1 Tax=Rotaria socialis TaxID=392032 RepID=A0A817UWZ2_9BILA|nr:unnamed protein product [Rotaria socialis]CAF3364990.1 unnamed protein product [Rotaria socialis]CAF3367327.1 unnamed protein product [Rotaria socialis]CAF4338049.1 unnamed protein product [Rotaria socialis]CAF4396284.1 unnamed protein product [Rotaria socialis]